MHRTCWPSDHTVSGTWLQPSLPLPAPSGRRSTGALHAGGRRVAGMWLTDILVQAHSLPLDAGRLPEGAGKLPQGAGKLPQGVDRPVRDRVPQVGCRVHE